MCVCVFFPALSFNASNLGLGSNHARRHASVDVLGSLLSEAPNPLSKNVRHVAVSIIYSCFGGEGSCEEGVWFFSPNLIISDSSEKLEIRNLTLDFLDKWVVAFRSM